MKSVGEGVLYLPCRVVPLKRQLFRHSIRNLAFLPCSVKVQPLPCSPPTRIIQKRPACCLSPWSIDLMCAFHTAPAQCPLVINHTTGRGRAPHTALMWLFCTEQTVPDKAVQSCRVSYLGIARNYNDIRQRFNYKTTRVHNIVHYYWSSCVHM